MRFLSHHVGLPTCLASPARIYTTLHLHLPTTVFPYAGLTSLALPPPLQLLPMPPAGAAARSCQRVAQVQARGRGALAFWAPDHLLVILRGVVKVMSLRLGSSRMAASSGRRNTSHEDTRRRVRRAKAKKRKLLSLQIPAHQLAPSPQVSSRRKENGWTLCCSTMKIQVGPAGRMGTKCSHTGRV
jgi:hypothetical protein